MDTAIGPNKRLGESGCFLSTPDLNPWLMKAEIHPQANWDTSSSNSVGTEKEKPKSNTLEGV